MFSFKKKAGTPPPVIAAPAPALGLKPKAHGPVLVSNNTPLRVEAPDLIREFSNFPAVQEVLSGVASTTPELRIPVDLQSCVIAVRISAHDSCVAYDPAFTEKVKPFLITFKSALMDRSLRVKTVLATTEVIKLVQENARALQASRSSTLGGNSDGVHQFREWVRAAKDAGSTDLHMRIMENGRGEVSVRVDGELEPVAGPDEGIFSDHVVRTAIKAAFESLADAKSNSGSTFSETSSMSCMIDSHLGIPNLRLRFSSQRGFFGPKAVVRLLPSEITTEPMSFKAMGFAPSQIQLLEKAQRLESGVVLQMGVTGSGKTTVAKTFMESHPHNGSMAMYQVADPIEYLLRNVHQIYVQRDLMVLSEAGKKDPYSEVIESLMRMDPDAVDVGEVRDFISARALANVGKSGHLAIGTLHVDSLVGAINRLTDPKLGLTRQELTGGRLLAFLSYQALVPVLCKAIGCALNADEVLKTEKDTREGAYLGRLLGVCESKLSIGRDQFRFKNKEGCSECHGRGTKGLTMVAEMMLPEDGWLDFAAAGNDREAMRWWRKEHSDKDLTSEDMNGKLVIEHTIYKALKGDIDPRNIERFGQLDALEVL